MPRVGQTGDSAYEARLVARFQAGDADALGSLFDLHVDHVFAYARHLLGSREDAEEVTSEAFLRAFDKAAAFRGESAFRGWLFGIARNLCRDRMRQPKLLLLDPEQADRQSDEGAAAHSMETSTVVRHAIDSLPEEQRMAVLLCDVEEWDAREAAVMLDRTVAALKSLLYRGRRLLRDRLRDVWGEEVGNDSV